ncbi:MAG: HEAT repeat domain-containing protein [Pseudomonadota bacterium]
MNNSTLPRWLTSVGVSFALGFGLAWTIRAPQAEPEIAASAVVLPTQATTPAGPAVAAQAPAARTTALPDNASVDELWTRALAPQGTQANGYDAEDRLRKLAQSNPVALRSLLQRYDNNQTAQARELLKSILATVQTPEVIAFSTRLASSSNMAERKYGFEMLQSLAPDSPEVRSLVKRTLANEQSPEVLVQALATLRSGIASPEESDQIVAQLKTLSQHADPAVRSQSLAQLGQWDKKGEGAERLLQGLTDRAPDVRQAAIFAIAQTGARSDALKSGLMAVVLNTQESKDVRGSALQALERFSLSKEEYAGVAQARAQILGH